MLTRTAPLIAFYLIFFGVQSDSPRDVAAVKKRLADYNIDSVISSITGKDVVVSIRMKSITLNTPEEKAIVGGLIRECKGLKELTINSTNIDDAFLDLYLDQSSQLNYLNLAWTQITERGMKRIAELKGLKRLELR